MYDPYDNDPVVRSRHQPLECNAMILAGMKRAVADASRLRFCMHRVRGDYRCRILNSTCVCILFCYVLLYCVAVQCSLVSCRAVWWCIALYSVVL